MSPTSSTGQTSHTGTRREVRPAGPSPRPRTSRRAELLREAARLFAERGYHGVSIEQIGAAVGIRGPGIYRHVANKEAMLVEMLVDVSERLLAGGQAELAVATCPADALDRLIRRHVAFALNDPDLIVVHDRDLTSLPADAARRVRRLQRTYVELWVDVLRALHPDPEPAAMPTPNAKPDANPDAEPGAAGTGAAGTGAAEAGAAEAGAAEAGTGTGAGTGARARARANGRSGITAAQARARAHALFGLINSTPHSAAGLAPDTMADILRTMALAAALA